MMFRRLRSVLIALDGSPYTQVAIQLGVEWAKRADGMLGGIAVVDTPAITRPAAAPLGAFHFREHAEQVLLEQERDRVEEILSRFSRSCAEEGVSCRVIEKEGSPEHHILHEAQRFDIVVVGRETFFHFDTGDNPDCTLTEIIKNSPRPVVTVPSVLPEGETVVIAYDGSLQAARALYAFWASGVGSHRPMHIVAVHHEYKEAAKNAQIASEFLHSHKLEATCHAIASDRPVSQVLLEKATDLNALLLVMGAYGKSRMREFFIGSLTRRLLAESQLPVFISH